MDGMKKVLLIIIDALASRVVRKAFEDGELQNFKKLSEQGTLKTECTSIFPSITPAATCSIITGAYPAEHGISGAYWYDTENEEVAYFGSDLPAIMNEGLDSYITDFQIRLNMERLKIPTIFERIEKEKSLKAAVINFMWYRGTVDHQTTVPLLLKLTPGVSMATEMHGPHLMYLGDFVSTPVNDINLAPRGGLTRRYGFHDESTADYLLALVEGNALPEFTLAYFPNNDFDSHKVGPMLALNTLKEVDELLGKLFEAAGGLEKFLEQYSILITGDHSQSDLEEDPKIDLDQVLSDYSLVNVGQGRENDEQLMVCPNMRSAQIYFSRKQWTEREFIIDALLNCEDMDQVIWSDHENGIKDSVKASFYVRTSERGSLRFRSIKGFENTGVDAYGTTWSWEGDLSAVDATVDEKGMIHYGDYPNAMERIMFAFLENSGNLWITARLGKEFCLPSLKCNPKGSHGSLHLLDSTAPLIAAGLPDDFSLPEQVRITDITPICLELLGLPFTRKPGDSAIDKPVG